MIDRVHAAAHPPAARRRGAAAPDRARMGERLRLLRKERGLTLKTLAARSGVPLSTLSKMELGQISVSYEKIAATARALQVDIARLFDPRPEAAAKPGGGPVAVRSRVQDSPSFGDGHYQLRLLAADFPAKQFIPVHGTIVARELGEFPDYVRHAGQEFVMVLSGRVRILFETGEKLELARNESAYFDSGVGHVYLAAGRGDAQVLVVMSEPA